MNKMDKKSQERYCFSRKEIDGVISYYSRWNFAIGVAVGINILLVLYLLSSFLFQML